MQQQDRRVWKPDETCIPCHLEILTGAAVNDRFLGQFTVPRSQVLVITSLCSANGADSTKQNSNCVNILRGHFETNIDLLTRMRSERWNGALVEVKELAGAGSNANGGVYVPGFILPFTSNSESIGRPCRFVLESDTYQVMTLQGPQANAGFILDGYMFPERER